MSATYEDTRSSWRPMWATSPRGDFQPCTRNAQVPSKDSLAAVHRYRVALTALVGMSLQEPDSWIPIEREYQDASMELFKLLPTMDASR
jgi:hypothetical protein